MNAPSSDGLPLGRRTVVIATVGITTVLSVLDGSISNIALPTIAGDLNVSPAAVIWVVNAFQLANAMLLVPLSALGDIIGFARIYRAGVAMFVVASVACAISHTLPQLVIARTLQGLAAAAILAVSSPLTRFSYPAAMLGMSVGVQSLIVSISSAGGPSIGGLILAHGSWPWLFWINVPFALVSLALSGVLPATPRASHRFDWISAGLSGATLVLFITGLDQLREPAHAGWFVVELIGAAVLGTVLVRRQKTLDVPLLGIDLFRIRIVRLSLMTSFVAFLAQYSAAVSLPFYFRDLGNAAPQIGLLMTPYPVGSALVALVAGWLADRYHAAWLGVAGLGTLALAYALLALLPPHPSTYDIIWRMALGGVGFGLFVSPNLRAMIVNVPRTRMGAINGLVTSARMTGATTGVAVTALIFSLTAASSDPGTVGLPSIHSSLWLSFALTLVALVLSALRFERKRDEGNRSRPAPEEAGGVSVNRGA